MTILQKISRIRLENNFYSFATLGFIAIVAWLAVNQKNAGLTVCPFHMVTSLPCPSCGLTRSVLSIFNGNFADAFHYHPLGYLASLGILLFVILLVFDWVTNQHSLLNTYLWVNHKLKAQRLLLTVLTVVAIVWFWNLYNAIC